MKLLIWKKILYLLSILLILEACDYSPEDFPSKIANDYELAFPIADTTLNFADIATFSSSISYLDDFEFTPGVIGPYSFPYPFYLADFVNEGYALQWFEPKAIIDCKFSSKVDLTVSFYLENKYGMIVKTLLSNIDLQQGENALFGDEASRYTISDFQNMEQVSKIVMSAKINIKETITFSELKESQAHLKIGLKIGAKLDFDL